jgi:hypothetical protein
MLSTEPAYCSWDKYFVITCLKAESMEPQYGRRRELQNPIGEYRKVLREGSAVETPPLRTVLVFDPFYCFFLLLLFV